MNAKHVLESIEGNDGDVSNNIHLEMAANAQESQEHNNNNYGLFVDSNGIAKKGELLVPNKPIGPAAQKSVQGHLLYHL